MSAGATNDPGVAAAAAHAVELVPAGAKVGLGSGRAASAFIAELGARRRRGFSVVGVPTSEASAALARSFGIPLIEITEDVELDLIVDGADEVTPTLDLVKGLGAAFVRERIVTAAARRQVILVGPEKLVPALFTTGGFPVEVIPLAGGLATRHLKALGAVPTVRLEGGAPLRSVNGNLIFDCAVAAPMADGGAVRALQAAVRAIPGVVDTGLFLGTAERVLVGYGDGRVEVLTRPGHP
ncbi:MAG TPA: ribose 5-phosphate isomerase A [Polyangia bacterium]|nr:ribose 5-phosphate isomerase A [Polyangia bacterium]